ncbi:MAG: endonuclease III, partial [bacterium]
PCIDTIPAALRLKEKCALCLILFMMLSMKKLKIKAKTVGDILHELYHAHHPHRMEGGVLAPVDELVLTILSQSTTDTNSWRGYHALKAAFSDWDSVADAPVEQVAMAIKLCGLSHQKAPRIQAVLQQLKAEHGEITLDFLQNISPRAGLDYLTSFNGVGRKTASCVLLFSLGKPVMPVDTHVHRVTMRLGLINKDVTADKAHDILEKIVEPDDYLTFHVNIIAHGRRICTARNPQCQACAIAELCDYYNKR